MHISSNGYSRAQAQCMFIRLAPTAPASAKNAAFGKLALINKVSQVHG